MFLKIFGLSLVLPFSREPRINLALPIFTFWNSPPQKHNDEDDLLDANLLIFIQLQSRLLCFSFDAEKFVPVLYHVFDCMRLFFN